ncbi:MAG TPA: single-stranded DNA-binding protein [Planctomycetota bacterium]|jgi:single-strand DNA-binding protein|nr:single-stranded DNA-binding protein [Planctomycetota bacterium]
MALQLNNVFLAGNLTRDPVVRFLANEQAVANFGLAINRKFKGADGQMKDDVTFVDCEAWGRTAEFIGQYLTKGKPIYLEGRLKFEQWDDKDGKKHSKLKVVADTVQFTESKGDGAGSGNSTGTPGNQRPSARGRDEGRSESADPLAGKATGKNGAPPVAGDDEPPF